MDLARPEDQETRCVSKHGQLLLHSAAETQTIESPRYSPEIDRADLCRLLTEALDDDDTIAWGHKLQSVTQDEANAYQLTFTNGATASADLVIGADGAWSRVRTLVSSERPTYTGATFFDCTLRDFDKRFPELVDLVGHGTLFAFHGGEIVIAQRNGYGVLRVYLGFCVSEDWCKTSELVLAPMNDRERIEKLLETHYRDWSDDFQRLIRAAGSAVDDSDRMVARPLYALPVGFSWPHRAGVTLLGDAAHVMSPCAGQGVNTALTDCVELARALAPVLSKSEVSMEDVSKAVAQFEEAMATRVTEATTESARNLHMFMHEETSKMVAMLKQLGVQPDSELEA
ncbi:hypothetical protein PINS_up004749 [Pythium insidiosum]|nr:hypothetical protein PINS_up004749 [Pythium insidiosum]